MYLGFRLTRVHIAATGDPIILSEEHGGSLPSFSYVFRGARVIHTFEACLSMWYRRNSAEGGEP